MWQRVGCSTCLLDAFKEPCGSPLVSLSLSYTASFLWSSTILFKLSMHITPLKDWSKSCFIFSFVILFWKAEKDCHEKWRERHCSGVPELPCKHLFLISLHLQSKISEQVSAFGHQLEKLVVMSTMGSKMLPPRIEEGTSVAVGLFPFIL